MGWICEADKNEKNADILWTYYRNSIEKVPEHECLLLTVRNRYPLFQTVLLELFTAQRQITKFKVNNTLPDKNIQQVIGTIFLYEKLYTSNIVK